MPEFKNDTCPVCSKNDYKIIGKPDFGNIKIEKPKNTNIVKCKNCDTIYVNPMPVWSKDDFELLYDSEYFSGDDEIEKGWFNIRENVNTKIRYEIIKKHIRTDKKSILELGSGVYAFMCKYLLRAGEGWKISAQEPSNALASILKKDNPSFDIITTNFLDFPDTKKYSLIFADSVFEHVPNPVDYFKKSYELLEDGGILYFISPNEHSFINFIRTLRNKIKGGNVHYISPYVLPYHLIGYSKKGVKILAEKSGLELLEYVKKYDYFWYQAKNGKNPLRYIKVIVYWLMDAIGYGMNLEIVLRKNKTI